MKVFFSCYLYVLYKIVAKQKKKKIFRKVTVSESFSIKVVKGKPETIKKGYRHGYSRVILEL